MVQPFDFNITLKGTSDIAAHLDRLTELRKTLPSRKREEP